MVNQKIINLTKNKALMEELMNKKDMKYKKQKQRAFEILFLGICLQVDSNSYKKYKIK